MITISLDDNQLLYAQWQQNVSQMLNEIVALGVTLPEYLAEKSIKNCYLYVCDVDKQYNELLFFQFHYCYDVLVKGWISDKKITYSFQHSPHFANVSVEYWKSVNLTKDDTVIFCTPNPKMPTAASTIIGHSGARALCLYNLLNDMFNYAAYTKPLRQFKSNNPDVTLATFSFPQFVQNNPTQNEKDIVSKNITHAMVRNSIFVDKKNISLALEGFDYTMKQLDAICIVYPSYRDFKYGRLVKDVSREGVVNVVNGRRITLKQPEKYKKTVYFVGTCHIFGYMVSDKGTIESHFQELCNQNNLQIKAENYGFQITGYCQDFYRIIDSIDFMPGDIVVVESPIKIDDNIHIDIHDLFNRPHNYGEIFIDKAHVNENGNKAIAEQIFDNLKSTMEAPIEEHLKNITKSKRNFLSLDEEQQLSEYLKSIEEFIPKRPKIGSIVMNCNPFTFGHRYLIEQSAAKVERLFVFVVEEDKSIFPFADRIELVRKGTADLQNVTVLPSGKFMISALTFTDYFGKSEIQDRIIDPSMDVNIFGEYIAPAVGINIRFAGEEPLDNITKQYNETMARILPKYGVDFEVIPRKEFDGEVISASRVRKLLETKNFETISHIVPQTTLDYLNEKYKKSDKE